MTTDPAPKSWLVAAQQRCGAMVRTGVFLLPFASMYAAYGATFGVIGGGAPLVLRARGMSLANIGLLQLIYLPIGIAFLWAPILDRLSLPRLPHRLGWILAGQGSTVVLLVLLASAATWPTAVLFALAFATTITMATADLALEALVVETVGQARRPLVTTAKLCGSSLGTMAGVALATAFPATLDLSKAVLIVALIDAALLLPMMRYPENQRRLVARTARRARPSRERFAFLARKAAVLGFFFAPAIMIVSVPGLVLLDLKLPLQTVGFFTGTVTTVVNIAMTVLSGALLVRMAAHRLVAGLAVGVVGSGLLFALAAALPSGRLGFAAALINVVFEGGLGVPVFNAIYQWSEGEHAATDYALLFGVAFLVSFPARVLAPGLAAWIGWASYFAVFVPVYAVAVACLVRTMARAPARIAAT